MGLVERIILFVYSIHCMDKKKNIKPREIYVYVMVQVICLPWEIEHLLCYENYSIHNK